MASLCAVPWGVSVRGLVIRGLTDSRLSRVTPLTNGSNAVCRGFRHVAASQKKRRCNG